MLKRNSYIFGVVIGILSIAAGYGFFQLAGILLTKITGIVPYLQEWQIRVLSVIPNVLLIRYYFINLKMDKTGRSILTITFLAIMGYFFFLKMFYN
jgi:hypothetical protein